MQTELRSLKESSLRKDLREENAGQNVQADRNISPSLHHCLDLTLTREALLSWAGQATWEISTALGPRKRRARVRPRALGRNNQGLTERKVHTF